MVLDHSYNSFTPKLIILVPRVFKIFRAGELLRAYVRICIYATRKIICLQYRMLISDRPGVKFWASADAEVNADITNFASEDAVI